MHSLLDFILRHGYVVLLVWVFVEQIGLPVPTVPLLLAAGALAGAGRISFFASLFFCLLAALAADTIWFQLGRLKGIKILHLLCKISLEPDSCVRRTQGIFSKQGARSLLFDSLGALLWAGGYLSLGYVFSGEIERIAERASALGGNLLTLLIASFAAYIAYKFIARQRFLHELRIARITVDELKKKIDASEELVIVDLRHSMDFEADPETIPGAFRMDAKELEE